LVQLQDYFRLAVFQESLAEGGKRRRAISANAYVFIVNLTRYAERFIRNSSLSDLMVRYTNLSEGGAAELAKRVSTSLAPYQKTSAVGG
jgi:hypothetical protein